MARRQQPPQINLTPIPHQWHRPGHAPERTRRDRAPEVDDDDLYLRPVAGQKKKGFESASRDGGYQNHIARDVSDREHYISPSHGHRGHTYRSLQPGTVQDQDKPFDTIPSGDHDDDNDHSKVPESPYDQIPEPVKHQNPEPIPKEISQPIGEPISKQPADPSSVPIPTRTSPRRAKKQGSRKLLVAVVVVVAVLAVGIGVGIGVGILIGAKDGPSESSGSGDTELPKVSEVAASLRLTLTSHVYTPEMADATSTRSQLFLQNFCSQVRQLMERKTEVNKYVGCTISSLREGSIIVDFTVVVVPVAAGFTPTSIAAVFVSTRGNLGNGWVFDVSKLFVLSHATGSTRPSQTTTPAPSNTTLAPSNTTPAPSNTTPAPTTTVTEEIINTTTPTVAERCQNGSTAVFPHPTECQLYYNCSNRVPRYYPFEDYMEECIHPQLFDVVTMQCQNYSDVDCGQREELVEYCAYRRNYRYYKDPPCSVDHPSCKGLSDGRNVYENRNWSLYYAECKDQRLVGTGECPQNQTLGVYVLFSPDLMRCASLYETPAEHGGYFLNCTGRADGLYADDVTNRPDLYFACDDGQLTFLDLCSHGYIFNSDSSQCQPRR